MRKSISILFLAIVFLQTGMSAERNLLAGNFNPETISEVLMPHQKWVPYPDYSNREAWETLFGRNRDNIIKRGERQLNYQWQVYALPTISNTSVAGTATLCKIPIRTTTMHFRTL